MEILFLLVPLSVLLIMALVALLAWALQSGQFDDLEHQGELVFDGEEAEARAAALRAARRGGPASTAGPADPGQPATPLSPHNET